MARAVSSMEQINIESDLARSDARLRDTGTVTIAHDFTNLCYRTKLLLAWAKRSAVLGAGQDFSFQKLSGEDILVRP
jgi:hypothetical protein